MNKLIDPEFQKEVDAIGARMWESKRLEIIDYRNDDDFKRWYLETVGDTFSADDNLNAAVDCYNQQQWCKTFCNPPEPPVQFHCRPAVGKTYRDIAYDANGYVLSYRGGKFQEVKCECLIKYETAAAEIENAKRMDRANIPLLFADRTFDSYRPQNKSQAYAVDNCRKAAESNQGVFLCGEVGTGKTHLAVAMLKVSLNRGRWGLFIRVVDFLNRLRPPNNDYALLEKARECDFLVLDDLGMQKDSGWTYEKITDVIDYRNANLLPMAITSNLTLENMAEIGLEYQRITSRIEESCQLIRLQGENYRRKIAAERARQRNG